MLGTGQTKKSAKVIHTLQAAQEFLATVLSILAQAEIIVTARLQVAEVMEMLAHAFWCCRVCGLLHHLLMLTEI
jgi:rubrerythrin